MTEDKFFSFDYINRRFSCDGKPLLDLGAPAGHNWSLSTDDTLFALASELCEQMVAVESQIKKRFSNEAFPKNESDLILNPIPDYAEIEQEHIYFANIIHYQALNIFFSNLDKEAYSFARFRVTWQWYWLSHLLIKLEYPKKGFITNKMLGENFRLAYNTLLGMIDDPVYRTIIGQQFNNAYIEQNTFTVDELYHLAIHLNFEHNENLEILQTITGPHTYVFENDFDKVKLHPKFEQYPTAVIRLISDCFLPSYNFTGAFKIATLLQDTRTDRKPAENQCDILSTFDLIPSKFFHNVPAAILSLIVLLIVMVISGTWLYDHSATWTLHDPLKTLLISAGELVILFLGVGLPIISKFRSLLVHLLLPRLVAGISVGYLAFVFQDNPFKLPNIIFKGQPLWFQILGIIILFAICFGFGFFYLYADITQFTFGKKKKVPKLRALTTWLIALFISFGIGLFACVFMTGPNEPTCFGKFLGPFGWFNLGILLFYMPISIVAGLISQFIFEEKSLTSPTWNAESMM